ncbi:MAG: hypothetical protein CUN55_14325 [Phototrophicales bacterium]|nr:MAG: hypothetical protein CUN55_14325 [Phototrophicales bacterium]
MPNKEHLEEVGLDTRNLSLKTRFLLFLWEYRVIEAIIATPIYWWFGSVIWETLHDMFPSLSWGWLTLIITGVLVYVDSWVRPARDYDGMFALLNGYWKHKTEFDARVERLLESYAPRAAEEGSIASDETTFFGFMINWLAFAFRKDD